MMFQVTLLQELSDRPPRAVQARYRLPDGTVQAWPIILRSDQDVAALVVESAREMVVPGALASLVAHYETAPRQEERQISRVQPA